MKKNKMKEFKKNLEKEKFSSEFIQKALQLEIVDLNMYTK